MSGKFFYYRKNVLQGYGMLRKSIQNVDCYYSGGESRQGFSNRKEVEAWQKRLQLEYRILES